MEAEQTEKKHRRIILIEDGFDPIPPNMVYNIFGTESITWVDDNGNRQFVYGKSAHILGTAEEWKSWIGNKEVWTSNNPMLGKWDLHTLIFD